MPERDDQAQRLTRRRFLKLSGASASAALLLAACGGAAAPGPSSSSATSSSAATSPATQTTTATSLASSSAAAGKIPGPPLGTDPRKGGVLRAGMTEEPNSFDSILAYNSEAWLMAFQLYSGLMSYDYNPQVPVPDLAEGMPKVSPDGLEYTFKLRPGLKFSSGAPVTAQDVKFSLERCLSPEWKSWGASYMFSVAGAKEYNAGKVDKLEGVSAPDPQTVVFKLVKPDVTFLASLALQQNFVTPAEEVKKLGKDFARKPVGTGPFMLKEYDSANQKATAVRNPNYLWQPLPYADTLEWSWQNSEDVIVLRIDKGELDWAVRGVPAAQFGKVIDDPKYKDQLINYEGPNTRWLGFNTAKAPFDNVKVRQAIGMAIDTAKQVKLARGSGRALKGIFPSTSSAYNADVKGFALDPAKARALLAEAGQANLAFELAVQDVGWAKTAAEAIQQDLKEISVKVDLSVKPAAANLERMQKGEASVWITGWNQVVLDPHDIVGNIHYSTGGSNYGKIKIPEVDKLIDQGVSEGNAGKRPPIYNRIEQLLLDNAVQVPLYQVVITHMISRRIRNFTIAPSTGPRWDRIWVT